MAKARSVRGEMVDFDLIRMKQQMATATPPLNVKQRQEFIEKRMRRRVRKVPAPAPKITAPVEGESKVEGEPQEFIETPVTEALPESLQAATEEPKKRAYTKKTTTQKARPKTESSE